ncbi:MAG TPA: SLC13 family permease [Steroidobacteraceae bacterium]|nr:SLC13 family permease [Steroidobacteraceae bacterium]
MPTEALAIAVFVMTYVAMALGRIPGLKLDRAGAALAGAAAMVACGALSLQEAYRAIDLNTITLLLGMMIVVAHLRLAGFFGAIGAWAAARARHPALLLAAIVLVSGTFSAFLVNDTVCLVLTPLVCDLAARVKRDPIPYLLAVAMASNAGSTATITGNPQNMIIGSLSGIPYLQFASALAPVAAIGLLLTFALLVLAFRREFWTTERLDAGTRAAAPALAGVSPARLTKSVVVALAMMAGFFAGLPPPEVAIAAAALMLITRRVESRDVYAAIDWPLLAMFAGLFIVVAGVQKWALSGRAAAVIGALQLERISALSAVTVFLSNVVSNVPAVLVLKPFVAVLHDARRAWLALAMAATLAGNLTLVGSIANLIVARGAEAHGIEIRFWTYLKVGVPLTLLTVLVGVLWL